MIPQFLLYPSDLTCFELGSCIGACMSVSAFDRDTSPERNQSRLLQNTDLVSRAQSLPPAFKELPHPALEFLSRVALVGVLALEREDANRAFEEQQSLVSISSKLSSCLDLEELLPAILSSLRSIARYDRAI